MKCLPASRIPKAQGNVLHDWHAEVLAIRAFNRFVLDECKALAQGCSSEFLRWRTSDEIASSCYTDPQKGGIEGQEGEWNQQPFTWREDVLIHMYCSEAPCGDASMELIMAAQEDATPWDIPAASLASPLSDTDPLSSLPGRAYFSQLGVVRRKPARSDAPPTLSKSCSDKLALRQCVSLLSSAVSLLVDPRNAYVNTLVMPESRYSESACRRCFSSSPVGGRMRSLELIEEPKTETRKSPYIFRPFTIETTKSEFVFSQRTVTSFISANSLNQDATNSEGKKPPVQKVSASNISAVWTRSGLEETTLGGILQGRKQSSADPRGASFASRRRLWGLATEVANLLSSGQEAKSEGEGGGFMGASPAIAEIRGALGTVTYGEMKECALLEARRRAKEIARTEALKGWTRNLGDESFSL
ncbi:adenosine deaminase/editase [Daldinia sp. FL1419]|nr:adenosine deaminase/editase [Daldinia sp. FL1419]